MIRRPFRKRNKFRRGVTLIEVVIAFPLVLVSASMLFGTIAAAARQRVMNQQDALVAEALREVLEQVRNEEFAEIFTLYNGNPFDDPIGPGTAPGASFAIEGLAASEGNAGGLVGEIILPFVDAGIGGIPDWQLREDLVLEELGMPRDLNGDHVIDAEDHAGDVVLLPILARARWQGALGPRQLEIETVLTEFLR